ncbi:MAG: hypothetical protein U0271_24650 [Polyangiaceae bacterium]
MRIRRVICDGVLGVQDASFDLSDASTGRPANIVAITGPAASGKTRLLEAVLAAKETLAPYATRPSPDEWVRTPEGAAKITLDWELDDTEKRRFHVGRVAFTTEAILTRDPSFLSPIDGGLAEILRHFNTAPEHPKLAYFHARRDLPVGLSIDVGPTGTDALEAGKRLTRDNGKFAGLVRFIAESGLGLRRDADGRPAERGQITQAFASLCATKKLLGLYPTPQGHLPGFTDGGGRAFGLNQLADSELDALLFAASWVRWGLVGSSSIVLIDTPERGRAEGDAAAFVRALSGLGPLNQIIVATRSESVARAANAVVRLG